MMIDNNGAWEQNPDDLTWSQAVPLPFYGLRKGCMCGRKFFKESSYRKHYKSQHTDGKKYVRTTTGLTPTQSKTK